MVLALQIISTNAMASKESDLMSPSPIACRLILDGRTRPTRTWQRKNFSELAPATISFKVDRIKALALSMYEADQSSGGLRSAKKLTRFPIMLNHLLIWIRLSTSRLSSCEELPAIPTWAIIYIVFSNVLAHTLIIWPSPCSLWYCWRLVIQSVRQSPFHFIRRDISIQTHGEIVR